MTAAADQSTTEEVLVLYGSQTGNSEAAAQELCAAIPSRLGRSADSDDGASPPSPRYASRVMHLDDFLELERGRWTRLVVIVCSSYGVGQAPIGARKFREWCDEVIDRSEGGGGGGVDSKMLEGVSFALLGLGDSHYTTFFQNPTTINKALTIAGATRVGEIGRADASGTDDMEQSKVIDRWIAGIWDELSKALGGPAPGGDALEMAQEGTWGICLELFPDWKPARSLASLTALYVPLIGVLVAVLGHLFFASGAKLSSDW